MSSDVEIYIIFALKYLKHRNGLMKEGCMTCDFTGTSYQTLFSHIRTIKAVSKGTPFKTENISASKNRSQHR